MSSLSRKFTKNASANEVWKMFRSFNKIAINLPLVSSTIVEVSNEGRKHMWSILGRVCQYICKIVEKLELISFSKFPRRVDVLSFVRI